MTRSHLTEAAFLKDLESLFTLSAEEMRQVMAHFHSEMRQGLAGEKSSLQMLPAFIDIPAGTESGRFIALDLGGTNFRVLEVELLGNQQVQIRATTKYVIPESLIHGEGVTLFDFIADCISTFLQSHLIPADEPREMGFVFSFPLAQKHLTSGILLQWTKEFTAAHVVGADVVTLLKEALQRKHIQNIRIAALANDTVGTLAAKAYTDNRCDMGIIFGTGTNACYRERVENIPKLPGLLPAQGHMIINMEWGNFDKLPVNRYDEALDQMTDSPTRQRLEKMVSGLYLGEIVRLVLIDLTAQKFLMPHTQIKLDKGSFKTQYLSWASADSGDHLAGVEKILKQLEIDSATNGDKRLIKAVCDLVSRRAACISAAAIAAVITWMDPLLDRPHVVGIDGSLYEKHPGFRHWIRATLKEILLEKADQIILAPAKDGSGTGVAIITAVSGKFGDAPPEKQG